MCPSPRNAHSRVDGAAGAASEGDQDMVGTTGDLMNKIMAGGIRRERPAAPSSRGRRRTPGESRGTAGSAMVAGWHAVRTLVATVLA